MPIPGVNPDEGAPWYAFAGALVVLGIVILSFPREGAWFALAVVLGALFAAEKAATLRSIPGPLAELGLSSQKGQQP